MFQQRLTLLDDGQYGGETPWPLAFERAGREAKFLWLAQNGRRERGRVGQLPRRVRLLRRQGREAGRDGVRPLFRSAKRALASQRPVYFASQFYGAGQVFYIGSGEMWRLRSVDPAYFEVLYTKLIRHVSQGRILRGSSRGALLVERDRYELGETVVLRARLADPQHKPLTDDSVTAQVLRPDGATEPVKLTAEADRPGMYVGQVDRAARGHVPSRACRCPAATKSRSAATCKSAFPTWSARTPSEMKRCWRRSPRDGRHLLRKLSTPPSTATATRSRSARRSTAGPR